MKLELTETNIEKSTLWGPGPMMTAKTAKLGVTLIIKVIQFDLKFLPTFAVTSRNH